jgi:hypothetical protein
MEDVVTMESKAVLLFAILFLFRVPAFAQKHELGITAGIMKPTLDTRFEFPATNDLRVDRGFTFQLNYAYRLIDAKVAALYVDVPLSVTPKSKFDTADPFFLRDYSSLFFTPGVKVKLLPNGRVSPYAVAGVGFARLSPGDERINGLPREPSADVKTDDAYSFGGGVDVKVNNFIGIRGDVRSFNTGTPQFSVNLFEKRQHNVAITGGLVLRF